MLYHISLQAGCSEKELQMRRKAILGQGELKQDSCFLLTWVRRAHRARPAPRPAGALFGCGAAAGAGTRSAPGPRCTSGTHATCSPGVFSHMMSVPRLQCKRASSLLAWPATTAPFAFRRVGRAGIAAHLLVRRARGPGFVFPSSPALKTRGDLGHTNGQQRGFHHHFGRLLRQLLARLQENLLLLSRPYSACSLARASSVKRGTVFIQNDAKSRFYEGFYEGFYKGGYGKGLFPPWGRVGRCSAAHGALQPTSA